MSQTESFWISSATHKIKGGYLLFAHYPIHTSTAGWTATFHCLSAILHGNFFGVFHFFLRLALYTITFCHFNHLLLMRPQFTKLVNCMVELIPKLKLKLLQRILACIKRGTFNKATIYACPPLAENKCS